MQINDPSKFNKEVFNVGGGLENSVSLRELTELCQEVTGKSVDISSVPETRNADVPIYITNNYKISQASNWKPKKSVRDIVSDTYSWIKSNDAVLRTILA
jgi:CDP-paratose 2-epimerase